MAFKVGINKVATSTKLNVLTVILIDPVYGINCRQALEFLSYK